MKLCNKSAFINDVDIYWQFLWQKIISNKSGDQIYYEVVDRSVLCMLYIADILEFVVDSFDERPFSEQYLVVPIHKRILHILPYLRDKVYVVNKKGLEKILAYVAPVCKQLSEQSFGKVLVFQ